jgi:PD-(D/E)XK nuclease superfamily
MQHSFPVPQNKHVIPLLEKELTDKIIGAAIEVHKVLGPGLLESAYQVCMERESTLRKIPFEHLVECRSTTKVSIWMLVMSSTLYTISASSSSLKLWNG